MQGPTHAAVAVGAIPVTACAIMAQAVVDPSILSIIGNGVTVVILAWYVIYDVRTRTPAMLAAFQKEQADTHLHYNQIIEKIRETFVAEQTQTRSLFTNEQVATRKSYDNELSELRKMLMDNLMNMRTAVHDVKDTAQALMNKQALADHEGRVKP